ncbi:hypothetical protein HS088_TW18G00582 [Tripterygium wilfordii]|uniref:Uncharacterized protein n=1 Tax=Tripterygium wilfordii TaxID=458696 RepID=A0A7J7CDU4_TRIWF|nr:hypothetical protein HS088_TW18G00582 [Tripterygium wilfordii]
MTRSMMPIWGGPNPAVKTPYSPIIMTSGYQIFCHNMKAWGVIEKSSSIIKSIRQHIDAWINIHELIPSDEERIRSLRFPIRIDETWKGEWCHSLRHKKLCFSRKRHFADWDLIRHESNI